MNSSGDARASPFLHSGSYEANLSLREGREGESSYENRAACAATLEKEPFGLCAECHWLCQCIEAIEHC